MAYTSIGTSVQVWCAGFLVFSELLGTAINVAQYRFIGAARKTDTITTASSGIGSLTAVSLDGVSVTEIDVTSLADLTRKYITGTITHGTLTVDYIAITNKNFDGYLPSSSSNNEMYLKISFGLVGEVFYALAVPQSFTMEAAVDEIVRGTITFRILDLGNHLEQD